MRRTLLGISRREAAFDRRGFEAARAEARTHLESIGVAFIDGYNAWLSQELEATLLQAPSELQGFAIEGAAMAAAILDYVTPWRRDHWKALLAAWPEHRYMIHVGAGWAAARLHRPLRSAVAHRDPLLGWLVADGWGFHQTYFSPAQWATGRKRFPARGGYLARAVDQGVGRALWFVAGADPTRVAGLIERFATERHADLWSGVGLAATYAGGGTAGELHALIARAGGFRAHLAQGAAFAATARSVAGNVTPHAEQAARILWGRSTGELAQLAKVLEPTNPRAVLGSDYETWRSRLRVALAVPEAA